MCKRGENTKKKGKNASVTRHHVVSHNWMSRLVKGALRVGAGEADHLAAENITMGGNTLQDCQEAIRLGTPHIRL